ncbi:class I SAM-dependent methyltransferase [Sulfitobacter sp. 1A15106]|uniref:class I SAM-dependent methyltransferase n=1 Tax=Sulfitobacter sp. 1A15106 TaxID=3368590 RepID=UPI00374629B8
MYRPFDKYFLSYSPNDGTIDFYQRVNALTSLDSVYLDYGAGRAAWFEDSSNNTLRRLRHMQGKFAEVIGADVDPIVMENNSVDRSLMIENDRIKIPDESIDVIVADYVIEHIQSPTNFVNEINRLLKPGGWFCARTPHKYHYIALGERIMSPGMENFILRRAQPERLEKDVFEKTYLMNTLSDISKAFPGWNNESYCRRCDPAYYFGSKLGYHLFDLLHRVSPAFFSGNLFVFIQKPK